MGTNYYLKVPPTDACPHCGHSAHPAVEEHIGKCSLGWHFSFECLVHKTAAEWHAAIVDAVARGGTIVDEYGRTLTIIEFWDMVHEQRTAKMCMAPATSDAWCAAGIDLCMYRFS